MRGLDWSFAVLLALIVAFGMLVLYASASHGLYRVTDAGSVCIFKGPRGAFSAIPKSQMPNGRCE